MTHRAWRLRTRPEGTIKDTDLELCVEPKPVRGPGELLLKNLFFSIDPTHRIWMSDKAQYMPCVNIGDIMRCVTLAVVEETDDPENYPVGTHFTGFGGVCEYFIGKIGENLMYKAGGLGLPPTADLSVCSVIIGLTAWHGVNKILEPDENSVFAVSGAAGAVGSLVGQLAKLRGAKVIGIAGGPQKCNSLKDDLKFDYVVDYKAVDVEKTLASITAEAGQITHYFDNVGGKVTDAVLMHMALNSKFSISEYDDAWSGQKNFNMILMRRITVKGYICVDHMAELDEAKADLAKLATSGQIKYAEDIQEGIENYPATVRMLMAGTNTGKLILKV